jgi:hypothetical protein
MRTMNYIDEQPNVAEIAPASAEKRANGGRAERAHRILARVLLGALALQFFFAGLGVFGVYSFLPHAILGALTILTSFVMPFIAWRGRLERSRLLRSWLLAGLMIFQGLLIDLGRVWPLVAAFHPANAMLLALLTFSLI